MVFISKVNNWLAKQLVTFVEFRCHGEQINAEGVEFFLKNGRNKGQTL